jgi:hypothetical protein
LLRSAKHWVRRGEEGNGDKTEGGAQTDANIRQQN